MASDNFLASLAVLVINFLSPLEVLGSICCVEDYLDVIFMLNRSSWAASESYWQLVAVQ